METTLIATTLTRLSNATSQVLVERLLPIVSHLDNLAGIPLQLVPCLLRLFLLELLNNSLSQLRLIDLS